MAQSKNKTPKPQSGSAGLKVPSRLQLAERLEQMQGLQVLVIGDVGIDRYTMGAVERISPEAPVPIVRVQDEQLKLGLAANVADNLKVLGADPLLCAVIGKDRAADDFKDLLKKVKIPHQFLVADAARRTVLKERIVSDRQQLLRVDYEDVHPVGKKLEAQIFSQIQKALKNADAVILQDYAKGMISKAFAKKIFEASARAGSAVAVDPNLKTPLDFYRGAFILTPNRMEAEALTGIKITDGSSLAEAGHRLLAGTDAPHGVITLGKEGMALFERGRFEADVIPTFAREVYDVSGAGDTVISVLTLALTVGASVHEAATLGNLAAGVVVGKRGTATVTPEEILEYAEQIR
jgi:rfaE bifunctional protein kinase chain/domain